MSTRHLAEKEPSKKNFTPTVKGQGLEEVNFFFPLAFIYRPTFRFAAFNGFALVLEFHNPCLVFQGLQLCVF